jgi:hypothetical protein
MLAPPTPDRGGHGLAMVQLRAPRALLIDPRTHRIEVLMALDRRQPAVMGPGCGLKAPRSRGARTADIRCTQRQAQYSAPSAVLCDGCLRMRAQARAPRGPGPPTFLSASCRHTLPPLPVPGSKSEGPRRSDTRPSQDQRPMPRDALTETGPALAPVEHGVAPTFRPSDVATLRPAARARLPAQR